MAQVGDLTDNALALMLKGVVTCEHHVTFEQLDMETLWEAARRLEKSPLALDAFISNNMTAIKRGEEALNAVQHPNL